MPNLFFYPYYSPYYSPYGFWGSGYGFGLNYLYYDPFWFGGYGYPGYGGYGYGGGYGGYGYDPTYYSSSGQYGPRETGGLRLRISPNHAQVFVDGYYVGDVDSFDGVFQRLTIEAGPRRIEIRAEGYETLQFDVLVSPGETVTYRGEMTRIQ